MIMQLNYEGKPLSKGNSFKTFGLAIIIHVVTVFYRTLKNLLRTRNKFIEIYTTINDTLLLKPTTLHRNYRDKCEKTMLFR